MDNLSLGIVVSSPRLRSHDGRTSLSYPAPLRFFRIPALAEKWPDSTGIVGRFQPESVAILDRNHWPDSTEIRIPELNRETYVPRASTPLLDALGRGINDLEKSLSELKEEDRPAKVVFVVVTDGQENSSREFRKDQIEKMIKEKTEKGSWQFVFLSADLAAIGDAKSVGIHADAVFLFEKSGKGSAKAWASLSNETSAFRASRKKKIGFGQDDRKHPDDPDKKKA